MQKLSLQEEQALQAVYQTGTGSIKQFLEQINESRPPYTTLASTIKNLEKKGYLKSKMTGNTNLYYATLSKEEYKKGLAGGMVKNYFDNSYKELVNFFVEQKKLSSKELREIIEAIEGKQKKL